MGACFIALTNAACVSEASPKGKTGLVSSDWTEDEASAISQTCGAPANWLKVSNGELLFQPDADGNYDVSVCVLQALKDSGKAKIGFVGNEAFRDDESQ